MHSPWSSIPHFWVITAGILLSLSSPVPATSDKTKPDSKTKPEAKEKSPPKITSSHYRIYRGDGTQVTEDGLLRGLEKAQVVFVGESHDDPVAHHFQKLLLEKLHAQTKNQSNDLALSLEMFERDVQMVLNEYLADLITEKHFLAGSRPWKNYKQDYRPLVEYAKKHHLHVIAANAPRRYVNRVGRLGRHSLKAIPNASRSGLPPLPYGRASSEYRKKFKAIINEMHKPSKKSKSKKQTKKKEDPQTKGKKPPKSKTGKKPPTRPKFDLEKALDAQSLWDASMAYSISDSLSRSPHLRVMHVNGSFHTSNRLGICDHLRRYRPNTTFVVVTIVPHKEFPKFDLKKMRDRGDFVIVTDASLPRSYVNRFKK